jgi:hypothetical protein
MRCGSLPTDLCTFPWRISRIGEPLTDRVREYARLCAVPSEKLCVIVANHGRFAACTTE